MNPQEPLNESAQISAPVISTENSEKKTIRAVIGKIGLDMIPVIAGILIALFINNVQQNSKDRRLLEATLQNLSEEFKENEAEIEEKLVRHQRLLDTLQKYS